MIPSLLIGLVAGLRSMTPLAAASLAARQGRLPRDSGAPRLLGAGPVAVGASALAVGELLGDKMPWAPDRTVPPGLAARLLTGGLAGAALARRRDRLAGAALGAAGAVAAGYLGLALRKRAMARYGQTPSGLVEDIAAVSAAALIVGGGARRG